MVRSDRSVVLERAEPDASDPALGPFLDLLAADLAAFPERLSLHEGDVLERARELVADVQVDLDTPLDHDPA